MTTAGRLIYDGQEYVTCEEVIGFLHDYLAGELGAERAHEFERHLSICDSCVAYLDSYRATMTLAKASAAEAAADLPPDLLRAILAARR